jgi:hypothetical protein
LEDRTLLSAVVASTNVLYLSDSQAPFVVVNNGTAVFSGTTTNPEDGFSQDSVSIGGTWVGGQVSIGGQGKMEFDTQSVDSSHRNFFLFVIPDGNTLSSLTAQSMEGMVSIGRSIPSSKCRVDSSLKAGSSSHRIHQTMVHHHWTHQCCSIKRD